MSITNTSKDHGAAMFLAIGADAIHIQEERGQSELVRSELLPSDMSPNREAYEALGFVFGEPAEGDPMFVRAALPAGWSKRRTDHSMWSVVVDATGEERVSVFYKAAFYDRRASMYLNSREEK